MAPVVQADMDVAITVALITAAVALFAPLANHRLAVWRERRARRAAASAAFRSAVLESLRGLYPEPVDWPPRRAEIINTLERRFSALQSAVEAYRPYLPLFRRWRFERAWARYRLGRHGPAFDRQNYWQYVPAQGERGAHGHVAAESDIRGVQARFRRNVARLLRFASVT